MTKLKYLLGFVFAFNGCELPPACVSDIPLPSETYVMLDGGFSKSDSVIESYCGDDICDHDKGETYWNCVDCVDLLTGGPKNGYCGDGICFNETMYSCWKDCKPKLSNSDSELMPPGPQPDPRPVLPQKSKSTPNFPNY